MFWNADVNIERFVIKTIFYNSFDKVDKMTNGSV